MSSQLKEKDLQLLDANLQIKVGQKPYEDGSWGTHASRDFVHFQLFDDNNNLIQFKNLPLSEFMVNTSTNNIEFYPGKHIRNMGYQSGTFNVKYNFLRKLAGDESSVLVHTLNTSTTKRGDVYTNMNVVHVTEDGLIFAATEEQYKSNSTTVERLNIEDLKYQIDLISPSRTEIRLKPKNINGSYIDEFVDIQTSIISNNINENIQIVGELYESKRLKITSNDNFIFTDKMVGGTITINDVYKIDEITVPARTENNFFNNPDFENVFTNSDGTVFTAENQYEWDSNLHDDAIRANNWTPGFASYNSETHPFFGTAPYGYHAKIVQNEGVGGSNCIKFTDQNEAFMDLPAWPNEQRYRGLSINQEMGDLLSSGISRGDLINISFDVKSTVANKGVKVMVRYPDRLESEVKPENPPTGYYNPNFPGSTETQPTSPPAEYQAPGTSALLEDEPERSVFGLLTQYDGLSEAVITNLQVGDTTSLFPRGVGAWIISEIQYEQEGTMSRPQPLFTWEENISDANGTLSTEGQWVWNGDAWVNAPGFENAPVAPEGTVNNPKAVNHHPFQTPGQGFAKYKRETYRGENRGWQTGTQIGSDGYVLFKDDLVWQGKANSNNNDDIICQPIEDWFDSTVFRTKKFDGEDGVERSLYDDIFENGFIQSVTRARKYNEEDDGPLNRVRTNHYIIFYNDGRGNLDTSNKFFQIKKGDNNFYHTPNASNQNKPASVKTNISSLLNDKINENNLSFEVTFRRKSEKFRYYYAVGSKVHRADDGNGDISNDTLNSMEDYPANLSAKFPHLESEPAAWFPKDATASSDWSRFNAIHNEVRVRRADGDGDLEYERDIQEVFYNAGVVRGSVNFAVPIFDFTTELTYGVRNPSADNYGVHASESDPLEYDAALEPIYDNGSGIFSFDFNPTKDGTLSEGGAWKWNGQTAAWETVAISPPRYHYVVHPSTTQIVAPEVAGEWQRFDIEIKIPDDWQLSQNWRIYFNGDGTSTGHTQQGIVWVDNVFCDFTLVAQSQTQPVFRPYSSQILSLQSQNEVLVEKSIRDLGDEIGAQDIDLAGEGDGNPDIYNVTSDNNFSSFKITYTNFNPRDLRTYLKFDNDLFLTTNFKSDRISAPNFPHSIVYKLYEPLPKSYEKYDECVVVKEMANPLVEKIRIIDFVPEDEPSLVLRTPDLNNVESPIQRRVTEYKTESDILTDDDTISNELRNEFLSQSLDSVEINTDYSRYENFVNFSSAETRVRNFKRKLEDIESHKISSASYIGVSGSNKDQNLYHFKIEDVKNNLDDFEKYMYFESSSYSSGSLGIFYDNAWPKSSGAGTLNSPYVLAHTTSSQANTWFTNAMESASLYDEDNLSKLSTLLPEHIKIDSKNDDYIKFTDMIGHHFDHIWEYINALSDTYDRRDKLDEGISKDLLWSVAKSLGWDMSNSKDLVSLPRYALGKEVTGSAYSDYSATSEKDISREIWSRIINNMPFFLKNKGTVRAIKGLINVYGIPSTILRVKEYGGPALPDNASPQYEIRRKFTKALDFKGSQHIKVAWANDTTSGRKPDTVEFRFRAATGSNQILVEKQDDNNQDWFIRLQDNGSTDNYGSVSFMLSGSKVGVDQGQYKEISSSALPIYDGDFYSVMVRRLVGSDSTPVSQSYELNVGKYDSSRSKIHLYSTSTMDVTQAASASFNNAWTGSGNIYIGGSGSAADVGVQFSGSIMEYRHWTEVLNTGSFKNHVRNPKAYDGNSISSSYENLVLRYSMNDDKDLSSDTSGIRDVSSNQTQTLSGSHSGFTGNFFRNVVDELKTHIPSIGALRRSTDKIRIESNKLKPGFNLSAKHRATDSVFDTAPLDSNKVGIWFAPTDVINNDIIDSVGDLNFDNYLGDPRDKLKLSYRGLKNVADNYWKKYTAPNNFWDYMRLIKYYDQSMYPQIRKMIPARAKPDIGLLIEPNIFERPKVILGRTPDLENTYYSSSVDITKETIVITGSYNHGSSISDYGAYTGRIDMYSYETGSSVVSSSGEDLRKEASGSEIRDIFTNRSIWQRLGEGNYSDVTMSFGDTLEGVKGGPQPVISGSRIYGVNQSQMQFYSSSLSASLGKAYSSSFKDTDLDNYSSLYQGLRNSFYVGVKNTGKTTADKKSPIEVIISAPTKLVTTEQGESTLTTGDGVVPEFKDGDDKDDKLLMLTYEEKKKKQKGKKLGLKGLTQTPISDQDKKLFEKKLKFEKEKFEGKLVSEKLPGGEDAPVMQTYVEQTLNEAEKFKGEVDLPEELEK